MDFLGAYISWVFRVLRMIIVRKMGVVVYSEEGKKVRRKMGVF